MPENTPAKSPHAMAADKGLFVGIYFCAMFLFWVLTPQAHIFSLLTVVLAITFPFCLFKLIRSLIAPSHRPLPSIITLWTQGIIMVSCGALLLTALSLVYLKWIDPTFMLEQLQTAAQLKSNPDPSVVRMADIAQGLIDNHAVPKASTMALSLWLFTVSSGSMLAGLMAILARLIPLRNSATHRNITH